MEAHCMTSGDQDDARGPRSWLGFAAPLQAGLVALLVLWISALSLGWPLEGDATVFHFLAVQHSLGSLPYRDVADMNFPLIYWIHDALVGIAGPGDFPFRIFDLLVTGVAAGLAVLFVWPAGRTPAVLAGLSLAFAHLTFGPLDEGQRDFLLLIPALAAAICATAASQETKNRKRFALLATAGFAVALAALFKPTAVLLGLLVFVADGRVRLTTILWTGLGFALGMAVPVTVLGATGALTPFFHVMAQYLPAYGPIDRQSKHVLLLLIGVCLVKFSGFVLAGALSLRPSINARARVAIFLVLFGVVHVLVQGKGYFYHLHPLVLGLILWGALGLASLGPRAAAACVGLMALFVVGSGVQTVRQAYAFLPVSKAIEDRQRALETALSARLPQGSRVEVLDAEAGGTLAMARARLRQATPDLYWFFFQPGMTDRRSALLKNLQAAPPAGVLVTLNRDLSPIEDWPEMDQFLAADYALAEEHPVETGRHPWENGAAGWKLYIKK
jgi:hypothetical protein